MRVKDGYVLRRIAESNVVVPLGEEIRNFNGIITLNEVGAFLFSLLKRNTSCEDLVQKLLEEYDVHKELASYDVSMFLKELRVHGMLIEDEEVSNM